MTPTLHLEERERPPSIVFWTGFWIAVIVCFWAAWFVVMLTVPSVDTELGWGTVIFYAGIFAGHGISHLDRKYAEHRKGAPCR